MRKLLKVFLIGVCTAVSSSCIARTTAPTSNLVTTTIAESASVPTTRNTTATATDTATRKFTLAVTGDILPHSQLWRGAQRNASTTSDNTANDTTNDTTSDYDFRPMFANVQTVLSRVDLAICHLETPVAPDGEEFTTYPFFGVPAQITDAIAFAGFDRCSTASNHTMDRGVAGIDATLDALDRVGVSHAGMARTPDEIEPTVFEVNGIKIAHMSYTFSYNGLPPANGESWRSALINSDRILRDAQKARKLGAQVVLVSLHWGNEREWAPSSFQQKIADAITKSKEVDLIIGSHAHVLQPIRKVNDTWVIYGLGNFLSNMPTSPKDPPWPSSTQDGAIVTTTISITEKGKVVVETPIVQPTWVDKISGWQIRLVTEDLKSADIPATTRSALQDSLRRTKKVLADFIND